MNRLSQLTMTIFLLLFGLATSGAQEPTDEQAIKIAEIKTLVDEAGSLFKKKSYGKCGKNIRTAMAEMAKLAQDASDQVLEELKVDYARIAKAQELLIGKGQKFAALPPLKQMGTPVAEPKLDEPNPEPGKNTKPTAGKVAQVSFTKQIAPVLVKRCGKCHVQGAKGGFSAANFKSIKKGSKKGKVFKAGDPKKSKLYSLVESHKMPPRSQGIPDEELKLLKDWVSQGAKYDGKKEDDNLMDFVPNARDSDRDSGPQSRRR